MVLANIENGAFSDEVGRAILTNKDVQDTLLNNIVKQRKNKISETFTLTSNFCVRQIKKPILHSYRKQKASSR